MKRQEEETTEDGGQSQIYALFYALANSYHTLLLIHQILLRYLVEVLKEYDVF